MRTLFVGYDLNSPGQDYADLIEFLKNSGTWWHHLDSTWLVRTTRTAEQFRNDLKAFLDTNDELLVLDVTGTSWATKGIAKSGTDWLYNNL